MRKIIINADDCGISDVVNEAIEKTILLNKISSTTIMANMPCFDGAIDLFNKYKDSISFGFHLNLTEGIPIRYSQYLLDIGFYIENNDNINFNGMNFFRKFIDKRGLIEIEKEIDSQLCKILDSGIKISHIDGHQHIHTSNFMLCLLPKIMNKYQINRVRNIRNLMPNSLNTCIRNVWSLYMKKSIHNSAMTDVFCSYTDYYHNNNLYKKNHFTAELMCHPGHINFQDEEKLLLDSNICGKFNLKIITYLDL